MFLPIHVIELSVRLRHYYKILVCGISGLCVHCYPAQSDVHIICSECGCHMCCYYTQHSRKDVKEGNIIE